MRRWAWYHRMPGVSTSVTLIRSTLCTSVLGIPPRSSEVLMCGNVGMLNSYPSCKHDLVASVYIQVAY
jgi:hypothetical protein